MSRRRRRSIFNDGQYAGVIAGPGRLYVTGYMRVYALIPR